MKLFAILFLLLSISFNVLADHLSEEDAWTTTFFFENDLFGNTDQNYTNGIKLSLASPDLGRFEDAEYFGGWIDLWDNMIPFIYEAEGIKNVQKSVVVSLGQKIFTPQDLQQTALIPNDRPYAGWLYIGTAFHTKTLNRLDSVELQLGMIGPASLAEEAQNFVHEVRGFKTAKGWDNQLNNEPAFAIIYEQKRRFRPKNFYDKWGFDVIGHGGFALGTVYTYGNVGAEARIGWNLPADFGTSLIRPGGDTNAPVDSSDPRLSAQGGFSVHAFAAITGRAVLRDIFLDGNTFSSSHSIEKKNLVGDLIVGASAIIGGIKFSYAQVFRTREFVGQADSTNFGSISVSWTF